MILKLIKRHLKYGLFYEARCLIEQQRDAMGLLNEEYDSDPNENDLPLLIMSTLINDENSAFNLCSLLIEKGYNVNFCDVNGLCALNYAIIFERVKLVKLFLNTFDFNLDSSFDCYNNCLLHYVYAIDNTDITKMFTKIFKKYYETDLNLLKKYQNRDGLSAYDLYQYAKMKKLISQSSMMNQSLNGCQSQVTFASAQIRSSQISTPIHRPYTTATLSRSVGDLITTPQNFDEHSKNPKTFPLIQSDHFFLNSNPIFIANRIKQLYNSKLTIKNLVVFDRNRVSSSKYNVKPNKQIFADITMKDNNITKSSTSLNASHEFQPDVLYKLKALNRSKTFISTSSQPLSCRQVNNYSSNSSSSSYTSENSMPKVPKISPSCASDAPSQRKSLLLKRHQLSSFLLPSKQNFKGWKSDISEWFGDYSNQFTSSLRGSAAPTHLGSESVCPSEMHLATKSTEDLANANLMSTPTNYHVHHHESVSSIKNMINVQNDHGSKNRNNSNGDRNKSRPTTAAHKLHVKA